MTYSFIKFNDELVDSRNMMELTDLARLLFRNGELTVNVQKYSYFNPYKNVLNFSMFWKHRNDITELDGFKHDIYTHFTAPGTLDYSKYAEMMTRDGYLRQIFLSIEYFRLRKSAVNERPVIKRLLKEGDGILRQHYSKHTENSADDFLRHMNLKILQYEDAFEYSGIPFDMKSDSTEESIIKAETFYDKITKTPGLDTSSFTPIHDISFSDIDAFIKSNDFRKDPGVLSSENDQVDEDEKSTVDTKTSGAVKDATVLGEVQDAANARRSKSRQVNMYDDEVDDYTEGFGSNRGDNTFRDKASINRHAVLEKITPKINLSDYQKYRELYNQYTGVARQAVGDLQQLLNHKQNEIRMNQSNGKLMKNPTMPIVEGSHKLFVKERSESREIDAVFTLVVDRSFSMEPHLENAISGVIVFNHILKSLNIKHRIISHHEDTFEVGPENFPNRVYEHMDFDKSNYYHPVSILDIDASGDNRDGFILKHEISLLRARSESDRFIIMFSDGLPSAEDYNQSGIVDTHEAVNIAKRENIHIVNVFISEESDEQTIESIRNIYGNNTILVAHAHEMAHAVANTLKKILLSLIN
ncbi:hypothetical protein [Salinicoccus halitifaciens]|uniref:Nitric oxide reductase activation protein n=1 Tax=Salinicoccus halitifaciens TaxID=1073415 RepID=A0ABV2E6I3_9STAP|nr:hypothetical protein [Salinicoccus halitifaciens]